MCVSHTCPGAGADPHVRTFLVGRLGSVHLLHSAFTHAYSAAWASDCGMRDFNWTLDALTNFIQLPTMRVY